MLKLIVETFIIQAVVIITGISYVSLQSASIKTSEYQSGLDYLFNSEVIKEIKKSFIHVFYRFHILFYKLKQRRRVRTLN